jgi:transcriptional regulator with XRE-family HTH domain
VEFKLTPMPSTLGEYLSEQLHKRGLSNRAVALGSGVSESVIRNLLQHGRDPKAKDPDPRTLRAVGDYLGLDSLTLFRLAGYIAPPTNGHSIRAEFLGEVFDKLSPEKQDAVMGMLEVLAESIKDQQRIEEIRANPSNAMAGFDIDDYRILRIAANKLIILYGIPELARLAPIDPDVELILRLTWNTMPKDAKQRILALANAKLTLDYNPTMVDPDWRW